MTLAEISIRRPVSTIVVSVLITLFGVIALTELGVREYPSVDPPTISITTAYAGAAADVVQAQITEPIEEALNTVAGIKTLTSNSREGASQISAEFSLDTNLETAASDVRDQLARICNLVVSKHIELITGDSIRKFLTECKKVTDARMLNKITNSETHL
jgi:multidrug efflux pump